MKVNNGIVSHVPWRVVRATDIMIKQDRRQKTEGKFTEVEEEVRGNS
jgi:hypothetical protein